jgi:insulysin
MHRRPAAVTAAAAKAAGAKAATARPPSAAARGAAAAMAPPAATMAAPADPSASIRVPVAETVAGRTFRYVQLPNRVRAVVVQDPAAAFGAVAAVVQAGYLSDGEAAVSAAAAAAAPAPAPAATPTPPSSPLPLHGLAHFLEHAVHLGSAHFPDEAEYKQHLAKHAGSSNASTSAATTRYHARCASAGLRGAVRRLGAALAEPLLRAESLAREVDNVHAEYSRNRNSDARRALQLRRASLGAPLSGFSTGSIETLRDAPAAAGVDVPAAMRELWRAAYVAEGVTAAVVGPQPVEELEAMVREGFASVRASASAAAAEEEEQMEEEEEGGAGARAPYTTPRVGPPGSGRTLAASCFPGGAMARLVRVAPMRELRELDLTWHVPYSTLGEPAAAAPGAAAPVASAAVAPWAWAAHVVGHEALGSAAELLKRQGLITELTAGVGEDVRLSAASPLLRGSTGSGGPSSPSSSSSPPPLPHDTGLMTWHVSVDLTAEGDARAPYVAATVHRAVELLRAASEDEWRRTWEHARACAELRFEHRDRTEALRLAQGLAASAAHYPPSALLSGPALYEGPFDAGACRAFLARLETPGALVVTHTSPAFRGEAQSTERWYGARHASEELPEAWLAAMRAHAAVDAAGADDGGAPPAAGDDPLAPRRGELFLPRDAPWALPQDLALREPTAATSAAPSSGGQQKATNDDPPVRRPELVFGSPGLHCWHALDAARFGVPKAQYRVRLVTPATYSAGPKAAVAARLMARVLSDVLEPELYDARVAGTSLELSTELDGLSLTASGFSDVLPRLLERALSAARALTLEQVERRFARVAGALRRDLLNWTKSNPQSHAEYAAERLLQPGKHHAEELLRELCGLGGGGGDGGDVFAAAAAREEQEEEEVAAEGDGEARRRRQRQQFAVTPADVLALCRAVFGAGGGGGGDGSAPADRPPERAPLHVDALLYGNLSRDEAAAVAASLERALAPPGIPSAAEEGGASWPALPVVDLSSVPRQEAAAAAAAAAAPPLYLRVANPNPSNANHAMLMVTQLPPPPPPPPVAGGGEGRSPASLAADAEEDEEYDGDDDEAHARQAALLDLFVQASSKACFHELRTVRRLGYSVSLYSASYGGGGRPAAARSPAAVDAVDGGGDGDGNQDPVRPRPIRHLCIRVQSPSTEPAALAAAAAEWLSGFRAALRAMPDDDLRAHLESLRARYLEPARSLADAAARAWRPLRGSRRDFAWRERKARAAGRLGREDLIAFYDAHLDPAASAALVVMVEGAKAAAKGEEEEEEEQGARAAGGGLRPPPLPATRVFGC